MPDTLNLDFEENEQQPLHVFTEKAYLNYAMYVILDRALPHVGGAGHTSRSPVPAPDDSRRPVPVGAP